MFKKMLMGIAALSTAVVPTAAYADEYGNVRVMNYSNSEYITSVEVTNVHGRTYDALQGEVITPGYNMVLNFDDGEGHGHCTYIAEARFYNGVTARRTMNVCDTREWRIYDIDNTVH